MLSGCASYRGLGIHLYLTAWLKLLPQIPKLPPDRAAFENFCPVFHDSGISGIYNSLLGWNMLDRVLLLIRNHCRLLYNYLKKTIIFFHLEVDEKEDLEIGGCRNSKLEWEKRELTTWIALRGKNVEEK